MRRNKKISDGPDNNICMGKRSELIAASYFLSKGCYVYSQIIEQGPIDLIVLDKKGNLLLFDVKTVSRRKEGTIVSRTLTELQRKLGVQLVYVCLETGEVHRYPHQFSQESPHKWSERNAANRQFKGEKPLTISELLHPKSLQKDQSSPEETEQCTRQSNPGSLNQRMSQDDADLSDDNDPQTEF